MSKDKYCVTTPDGDCVSTDPRCMHQPRDFLDLRADPELLAQERIIATLHEALYALLQAVECNAVTEGDINQARHALATREGE